MSLQGKIALVTGASRGLGEGAARALADQGAEVMLVARDGALVQAVAREIGGEAMACDVSDYEAVERAVAATRKKLGRLDIVVNNAGVIDPIAQIAASDPAAWARNIQINLIGAYNVVRAVLPGMLAAWRRQRSSTSPRAPPTGRSKAGAPTAPARPASPC